MTRRHEESDLLSAYLDGELGVDEQRRTEAHLAACPSCRAALEGLRSVKHVLASAPSVPAPDDLVAALEERWRPRPGLRERLAELLRLPTVWVPAGALALAALALALWFGPLSEEEIPLEPLVAAHARFNAESWVPHGDLLAANFSAEVEKEYDK